MHMAFGEDIRFLAILTGYADCQLIFLDTSRMRVYNSEEIFSLSFPL